MDILFWSGGKDAYLALEFYGREHPACTIKLLSTFEEKSGYVPHQNIPVDVIKNQAEWLGLKIILVPLPEKCPNKVYLQKLDEVLNNQPEAVKNLIFGDWYLQDIRTWREEQFNHMGYTCVFPIWEKELDELLPLLLLKPVKIKISAVADAFKKYIAVGEIYNQHFVQQLPKEIDPMGEKGEFHTEVIFSSNI